MVAILLFQAAGEPDIEFLGQRRTPAHFQAASVAGIAWLLQRVRSCGSPCLELDMATWRRCDSQIAVLKLESPLRM